MTDKERLVILAEIEDFYIRLGLALNHRREWGRYVEIALQEEKEHYPAPISGGTNKLTIQQAARLFCCRRVLSHAFELQDMPRLDLFFLLDQSEYAAYAIAAIGKEQILDAFTKEEAVKAQSWNYAALNWD